MDTNELVVRKLNPDDLGVLSDYFRLLGSETRSRFGPHSFEINEMESMFANDPSLMPVIIQHKHTGEIIAYSVVKLGYLDHDSFRLNGYGLTLDHHTDATYAPSVADNWQGKGLGKRMFAFILNELKSMGRKRIILWGGVQCSNERAVVYYQHLGFVTLGQFEYHGLNYDMILDIV